MKAVASKCEQCPYKSVNSTDEWLHLKHIKWSICMDGKRFPMKDRNLLWFEVNDESQYDLF